MATDPEEGPWFCWRCRAESTFPHSWCGTLNCDCDECLEPDVAAIGGELLRRWPGHYEQVSPDQAGQVRRRVDAPGLTAGQLARVAFVREAWGAYMDSPLPDPDPDGVIRVQLAAGLTLSIPLGA